MAVAESGAGEARRFMGLPDVTALNHFELGDRGGMQRERALDADAEGDLPDREGLSEASAGTPDHDTLEHLHSLSPRFHDPCMHLDGVAGAEHRESLAQVRLLDEIGGVHGGEQGYQRDLCARSRGVCAGTVEIVAAE